MDARDLRRCLQTALAAFVWLSTTALHGAEGASFWPVEAVKRPEVPAGAASSAHPIDAFLAAKWRSLALKPVALADNATLLRRVYLDLTGIPPSAAELDAFLRDQSPDAYERVVDRLLESEQHGVRYARHWMDVLRYADVDERMPAEPGIHLWRDWLISALNRDLPYDRFVRAQLAGDVSEVPDDIFATGFLARGAGSVRDADQGLAFAATETVSTAFMGLTVGCAKCHDHMYDPIAQKDFYALKALFDPLVLEKRTLATAEQIVAHARQTEAYQKRRAELDQALQAFAGPFHQKLLNERIAELPPDVQAIVRKPEDQRTKEEQKVADDYAPILRIDPPKIREILTPEQAARYDELRKPLQALQPPAPLPVFWSVREDPLRAERKSHILLGGDPEKKEAEVEPGFPFAPPVVNWAKGRRQAFLDWLTAPENPLFARVAVNRLWQWHFGEGLVPTASDFGNQGEKPSHRELLDWLAAEFVARGYSMRAMHRLMVTSEAYRRASTGDPELLYANNKIDAKNTYLWRFRLRRLEAEAIRDSILSVSGSLDLTVGGLSFRDGPEQKRLGSNQVIGNYDTRVNRRGIYMGRGFHSDRELMPGFLQVFDAEDGRQPCPRRNQSVTAPQALTLMNSEVVTAESRQFADRLLEQSSGDLAAAVDLGYKTALARPPSPREKDRALTYVGNDPERLAGLTWILFNLDEFLYVK